MAGKDSKRVRDQLEERLRAINEEIKAYPQPIARCDAQLGGLLDERLRIREALDAFGPDDDR